MFMLLKEWTMEVVLKMLVHYAKLVIRTQGVWQNAQVNLVMAFAWILVKMMQLSHDNDVCNC